MTLYYIAYAAIPVGLAVMIHAMFVDFMAELKRVNDTIARLKGGTPSLRMKAWLAELDRLLSKA